MQKSNQYILIDSHTDLSERIVNNLGEKGYQITLCNTFEQAQFTLDTTPCCGIIINTAHCKEFGFEIVPYLNQYYPDIPINVLCSEEDLVKSTPKVLKPIDIPQIEEKSYEKYGDLIHRMRRVINDLSKQTQLSTAKPKSNILIFKSDAMGEIFTQIEKVKNMKTTVLITGESGTGKGVVAKYLHTESTRCNHPFIHVDCGALPPSLIESELFGHEKGAFTGATSLKRGKFELAAAGTIFLDEINSLPLDMQVKLLVILQDHTFYRIGGTKPISSDARIIAATNKNLEEMIIRGEFREDLYYRLSTFKINMPPLRDRKDDIMLLANVFLERANINARKSVKGFSQAATHAMLDYDWPGNARELENSVEHAVIMTETNLINESSLPPSITGMSPTKDIINRNTNEPPIIRKSSVDNTTKEFLEIKEALLINNGHREKTAKYLGISRRTLQYKLKKYNLS